MKIHNIITIATPIANNINSTLTKLVIFSPLVSEKLVIGKAYETKY